MAKKAELKNVTSLQGVNIFKNGLLPTPQAEAESGAAPAPATVQSVPASGAQTLTPAAAPEQSVPLVSTMTTRPAAPPAVSAAQPDAIRQPPALNAQPAEARPPLSAQKTNPQEEKKMLRSYHLPESLIQRLEDAQMVYQLRKEKTNKQDIVIEALTRYLDELERQGFFNILKALRT